MANADAHIARLKNFILTIEAASTTTPIEQRRMQIVLWEWKMTNLAEVTDGCAVKDER